MITNKFRKHFKPNQLINTTNYMEIGENTLTKSFLSKHRPRGAGGSVNSMILFSMLTCHYHCIMKAPLLRGIVEKCLNYLFRSRVPTAIIFDT